MLITYKIRPLKAQVLKSYRTFVIQKSYRGRVNIGQHICLNASGSIYLHKYVYIEILWKIDTVIDILVNTNIIVS